MWDRIVIEMEYKWNRNRMKIEMEWKLNKN